MRADARAGCDDHGNEEADPGLLSTGSDQAGKSKLTQEGPKKTGTTEPEGQFPTASEVR